MFEFISRNFVFALLLLAWTLTGMYAGSIAALILVIGSLLLFKSNGKYPEILWGFILVLTLSDSRQDSMHWAGEIKNYYILLIAFFYFFDRKNFNYPSKIFLPFVFLFVWAIMLITRNPEPVISGQKVLSYILLFVCIPPFMLKLIREYGHNIIRDTIHFLTWILLLGLLLLPFLSDYLIIPGDRYNGLLGNPNGLGIFCSLLFFMFHICKNKYPDLFRPAESYFIYGIIAISLILSGSRNSMMSIILFLLFSNTQRISPWISFLVLIAIGISYQLIIDNLAEIMGYFGLEKSLRAETITEASGRVIAWKFAWIHIQENFFVGLGWDYNTQLFLDNFYFLSALGHNGGVHNVTLAFWLDLGLVGVVLFYYGFLRTFFLASKNSRYALPMMFGVLFSITFEAWLEGSLNPYTINFLITLVLLLYEPNSEKPQAGVVSV